MDKNPILNSVKGLILYLAFWIVVSIIYFFLLSYGNNINSDTALIDSIVFNLLLCGLGLGFWYPARFITFETNSVPKILIQHAIGGIFATSLWLITGYFITINFFTIIGFYSFFISTLAWRFLTGFLFYSLLTSFYYLFIYYQEYRERALEESQLKTLVTEAELKSLKFQINPHFIFNSLNSMSALTTIEPERAREMILKLAEFLRYTLANNEKQKNVLLEELNNIKLYLDIEKIRFEDKFEYVENVTPECYDIPVPSMILQPLFENAIKHSVYESLKKITLQLDGKIENGYLKLSLQNNYDSSIGSKKGTGIGLKNIASRLELLYNRSGLLEINKNSSEFIVNLLIPVN